MCHRFAVALVVVFALFASPTSAQTTFRYASWNIEATGTTGSLQWTSAATILSRIDADVVGVEEITNQSEVTSFPAFAAAAGYPYNAVSTISGTLSGNLYVGVLSKFPIVSVDSFSSAEISGDSTANDISRDILQVQVQAPNAAEPTGIFVVHLKSGTGAANNFRRAVEIKRLIQVVGAFKVAHPNRPFLISGDFNEDIFDAPFGNVYTTPPTGLPTTYDLGSDITLPVTYDPFNQLTATGLAIADATQEDSTSLYATRQSSGRRIDYIFYPSTVTVIGDEVYNSARDNGTDDAPAGNWLAKTGVPPVSTASNDAADHFTVFADLSVQQMPQMLYPGSNEDFVLKTGINGTPTTGVGLDVKQASTGDLLFINFASPSGTFDLMPPLLVGQQFATGFPPAGALPGLWVNTQGGQIIINGLAPGPFGLTEVIVPGTGNTHIFQIPAGIAGTSVILQSLAVAGYAANGIFAMSDAHEIRMVP